MLSFARPRFGEGRARTERNGMIFQSTKTNSTSSKSILIALAGGMALLSVFSCSTVPPQSLSAGEVRLLSIAVEDKEYIKANAPMVVNFRFESDGKPEIKRACISFSGQGPSCTDVRDYTYGSPGTIRVETSAVIVKKVSEFNVHTFVLEGYVLYEREGKRVASNGVSTFVQVYKSQ